MSFPSTVAGYELLAQIGRGGMGNVYLARREVLGGVERKFAVKLLHAELRGEAKVAQELLDEAQLAARINHPNVVEVVGGGTDGEHVYVAMEYVEGVTLAEMVRFGIELGNPIDAAVVARVVCDALAGLHAAHEARDDGGRLLGLIHRDFSPQNILVSSDGVSKLADFGIAKALNRIGGTATGVVKGKVSYLSPEQALGKPLDRRSDIWSAGVVLWEALVGKRLFAGKNDTATLLEIVNGQAPPPPSSRRVDLGPAIDAVVMEALQRDHTARIADAREMRDRIIAAWRVEHDVADQQEVAHFIAPLLEPKLVARRREIDQLDAIDDAPTALIEPAPSKAPRGRVALGAAMAVTLGVGLALVVSDPDAAILAPAIALPSVDLPAAEITLRANEPIAQLEIDGVNRIVPAPAKQIIVARPTQSVVALTADGRRVTIEAPFDRANVDIAFAAATIPKRVGHPVAPVPKQDKGPGLGPSPYNDRER